MTSHENKHTRTLINPPGSERVYNALQFSQAVRVDDTIWVSGQVGVDDGKVVEGIEAQARAAFKNIQNVLAEAGAQLTDVVELISFHTSMDDIRAFGKVKSEFFPENYPAWTAVGVTALAGPGLLVEVRATAVIGSSL